MRRFAFFTLVQLLAVLALALPAQAVRWCKTDPIVQLNGTSVQVLVSVPEEYAPLVNGPIRVEVRTPLAVARELVFTDSGFNGYGEDVSFTNLKGDVKNNTFPTEIQVQVPVDRSHLGKNTKVPVQVEVYPDNAALAVAQGTSDGTTVKLSVTGR